MGHRLRYHHVRRLKDAVANCSAGWLEHSRRDKTLDSLVRGLKTDLRQ